MNNFDDKLRQVFLVNNDGLPVYSYQQKVNLLSELIVELIKVADSAEKVEKLQAENEKRTVLLQKALGIVDELKSIFNFDNPFVDGWIKDAEKELESEGE